MSEGLTRIDGAPQRELTGDDLAEMFDDPTLAPVWEHLRNNPDNPGARVLRAAAAIEAAGGVVPVPDI